MLITPWKHEVIDKIEMFGFHDSSIMGLRRIQDNQLMSFYFTKIGARTAANPDIYVHSVERMLLIAGGVFDEWFFYEHWLSEGEKPRRPTPADHLKLGLIYELKHGTTPGGNKWIKMLGDVEGDNSISDYGVWGFSYRELRIRWSESKPWIWP